jgi:hypothetical protein
MIVPAFCIPICVIRHKLSSSGVMVGLRCPRLNSSRNDITMMQTRSERTEVPANILYLYVGSGCEDHVRALSKISMRCPEHDHSTHPTCVISWHSRTADSFPVMIRSIRRHMTWQQVLVSSIRTCASKSRACHQGTKH